MIDAALDCVAEVLWQDAGHRAPMQVTADGVEKLHGRALRIVEADKAALAPDRQHAGKVCIGAVGSELVKGPRKFGEAGAFGDDQPPKTDGIRSHRDLHIALRDVSERMADVRVNDLGVAERGKDALGAFLYDRGEQAVLAAEKRIYGGLGRPGALDDKVDGGAAVAVLQKDFDGGVQNLRASYLAARSGPQHCCCRRHGPLFSSKRNVHYVIIGGPRCQVGPLPRQHARSRPRPIRSGPSPTTQGRSWRPRIISPPSQVLGEFDHRQWKLQTTSVQIHGCTVPCDAPPRKMPRASSSRRNGFSEFTAIAKSPWRISRMPAASPPPTSIGISQAAAQSSTGSRPTTCTRPNAQRLIARSATAIRRGTGSVAF